MFRPAPRVREDEGRPVTIDQAAEEVVHPSVRDLHRDRRDVAHGTQDGEIEGFPGVDLDDVHVAYLAVREPGEELRLLLDRGDGRAQTDPDEILPGLLPQALQTNGQEGPAFGRADLVDLVEDDPFDLREVFAELWRAQDDGNALRRRDENVRWPTDLLLAFLGRRVPGSDTDPDQRLGLSFLSRQFREISERLLEVAVDIVR